MRTQNLPTLTSSDTLLEGLQMLERLGLEIVLIVDGPKLLGILTDGDVRRGLLEGMKLDCPLSKALMRNFRSVGPEIGRAEVLDIMKALAIKHLPVIDLEGNLLGLHLLHDIIGARVRPNAALILCGGLGTRLRPITEKVPKPMIPIAGRPILERIVLHLIGHGIRTIYLAIHYLGQQIQDHFGDGTRFGCRIHYIVEPKPLGTGGAFALLPEEITEPVLVMNGDLVTQFDVGQMVDHHIFHKNVATVGVQSYSHQVPFGVVEAEGQRVLGVKEKPILDCTINAGIYVLEPSLRQFVPRNEAFPMPGIIEKCLSDGSPVGIIRIDEDWIDIGRHEELTRAQGKALQDI